MDRLKRYQSWILGFGGLGFLIVFVLVWRGLPSASSTKIMTTAVVQLGSIRVPVGVAATESARYQGLSDRQNLAADSGLLFVFKPAEKPVFVMRNMKFPLDIIWIAAGKIIQINSQLPPEGSSPKNFYQTTEAVDYVLEVNAGFAARQKLAVGNKFFLNDTLRPWSQKLPPAIGILFFLFYNVVRL